MRLFSLLLGLALLAGAMSAQPTKPTTIWDPSPNYTSGRGGASIDAIVIHTTEGSYSGSVSWLKNTSAGASAHYVIKEDGSEITQLVDDADQSWHATYYNKRSIGIECAGYAALASTWTQGILPALYDLVAWLCYTYNVQVIHPAGDAYAYPSNEYDEPGLVGHGQIQPWNRTDPGAYFDWNALVTNVNTRLGNSNGLIIDNTDSGFSVNSGTWSTGTSASGRYGADYRFISTVGSSATPTAECEWRPDIQTAGTYDVAIWFPQGGNRPVDSPFTIHHSGGSNTVRVDQTSNGGGWYNLGSYDFAAGTSGYVALTNDAESGKVALADAVRFLPQATPGSDEFRGVWVSRYEWPSTTPATWKSNLDTIMNNADAGNYNAVVLQMRGTTETLYPSPNEPLSGLISLNAGDDPLSYAINAAHAKGLQLHCYFNTHVCTAAFASSNPGWVIADSSGTPISAPVDGYYWLAPGHPDVQQYLREQIMYIVNTYPQLDGIHFDRIRMPEPQYSHDTVSENRRAGRGNPDSLSFDDWTADQITRFLRDVYAEVHSVNPDLQLSAAPLGLYEAAAYSGYPTGFYYGKDRHQDAKAWLAQGCIDWIAPQCYWPDGGGLPDFSDLAQDWQNAANGRHVYPGMSCSSDSDASETASEITAARGFGCAGGMTWSYGGANSLGFWSALTASGQPYEQPAAAPDLPWLSTPTTAIVYGYVTDYDTGVEVPDAWVTVNGQTYTALSGSDGFWCWLEIAPGDYTFTFDDPVFGTIAVPVNNLQPGEVRRVDIAFGDPNPGGSSGGGGGSSDDDESGCAVTPTANAWWLALLSLLAIPVGARFIAPLADRR